MEKTILKEEMRAEAIARMKMLHLHENVIREFEQEGKLNKSEHGALYWLTQDEKRHVKQFEDQTGYLVYHAILSHMEFGNLLDLMFVSKRHKDWEAERNELANGEAFIASVLCAPCETAECGMIGIKPRFGAVIRIW